jgi:hypothetical protein
MSPVFTMRHAMAKSPHPEAARPVVGRALVLYAAAWVVTGSLVAAAILIALPGGDASAPALPPVQQTELTLAAHDAGCELRSGAGPARFDLSAQGPPAQPAATRVYEEAPPAAALTGALRRGVVVISYRPNVPEQQRDELRTVQTAVPHGTIVTPNDRMPFMIAATAWRRQLRCRRVGRATLDAVRLFRGRYLGSGPDSPR